MKWILIKSLLYNLIYHLTIIISCIHIYYLVLNKEKGILKNVWEKYTFCEYVYLNIY